MLVRLTCARRATIPLAPVIAAEILDGSRRRDPPAGITGFLCVSGVRFVPVLEGGRAGR